VMMMAKTPSLNASKRALFIG